MYTNSTPLLTDSFLYSYTRHISCTSHEKRKETTLIIYIDVLSLHACKLGDFVGRINPIVLEIKDTTDTAVSASYLEMHLEIDSEDRLRTRLYDKRDDYLFGIFKLFFSVITCIYCMYCTYLLWCYIFSVPKYIMKKCLIDWLIDWCLVFNATFSNISAISWRPVEEAGSTRREPPTMGKQLVSFITCGCESSAPFL